MAIRPEIEWVVATYQAAAYRQERVGVRIQDRDAEHFTGGERFLERVRLIGKVG